MAKKNTLQKTTYESYANQKYLPLYEQLIGHTAFTSMSACGQALLVRLHFECVKTVNKLGNKNGELQFSTSRLQEFLNVGEKKALKTF